MTMRSEGFEGLREYLAAYEKDPTLAVVPVPLVAEYFGITAPSVTARLRSAKLDGLRIGRQSFVLISSIVKLQKSQQAEIRTVEEILIYNAKNQCRIVFYEPIMTPIGLKTDIPWDRKRIGEILGDISRNSHKAHNVLLSVLVHRSKSGATQPGKGFFELAAELGYDVDDERKFVTEETERVLRTYA
ncbi:MAG: hypothetical protein WAS21_13390 [Geminicoccaceae bacterium]